MEEKLIRCVSTSTMSGKYGVVKAWLKLNKIDFEESEYSAGCHYWKNCSYELTIQQLIDLLDYLRKAEVLERTSDISV